MTSITTQQPEDAGEISLAEIGASLWARRWLIAIATFCFALIAAIFALLMTPQFEASITLSPVSDEGDGGRFSGASALLSQFGGLSALGGISFSASNRKSEAMATLQSRALTQTYINEKNLMPVLFEDDWDQKAQAWKNQDPKKRPTLWLAEQLFGKSIRNVAEDKKTGLVTMTITWKDPAVAAIWANDLVARANQYLRQKSIDQSNRNIGYLNDQLGRTSVVELQRAIYSLIESEIKKVMIAQGSDEYAFKVVDPAVVPEQKVRPKRALIVLVAAFVGAVLAMLYALAAGPRATRS